MKTLSDNFRKKFFENNPTCLDDGKNVNGQVWKAYEHPYLGDAEPVYILIDNKLARSDFYETGDFYPGSEYEPVLINGEIKCSYEVN